MTHLILIDAQKELDDRLAADAAEEVLTPEDLRDFLKFSAGIPSLNLTEGLAVWPVLDRIQATTLHKAYTARDTIPVQPDPRVQVTSRYE